MEIQLKRDAMAAVVIAGFGACTALYTYFHYPSGTVSRMGPGMFPLVLGVVLILMGALLLVKALLVEGQSIVLDLPEASVILGALVLFGLLIRPFGMIPSVAVLVAVSTAASPPFSLRRAAVLAASVTLLIVLIFNVAMRLNIPLMRWPF